VESYDRQWAEQVKLAQDRERKEQERKREFRLQVQQRNLGERDAVTIKLEEPLGRGEERRGKEEEEEEDDEEILRALDRGGKGGGMEGGWGGMSGASVFHTSLRVLVGDQPKIVEVEGGRAGGRVGGREAVAKASGWPISLRYKRCWEEAVASLFEMSTEARGRLGRTFYR